MKNIRLIFLLMGAFMLFLAGCGNTQESGEAASGAEGSWQPEKPIEVVAPAGPGGGWDTTARAIAKLLESENIIDQRMAVVNKPGGGGAVGWAYVNGKAGDNHTMFIASPPLHFVPLNGQSDLDYQDFTPLSAVIADYAAFIVKADSPYNSMTDLVEALKKDPQAVSVVGDSAPGSMDHMQFVKAVKAGGVDVKNLKYVSAQDGGGMSMLLGGKVDVYSTGLAEATEQARAGKVKVLAITAPERLEGETISEFPTLKEQGIDDEFVVWRGFFGPKDMDPAAVKYYEDAFKQMMETEQWKEVRDNFGWTDNYMNSEEFAVFLEEEHKEIEALMEEVGLKQ
ncbi:tripartite tricarboxylate transporter substrate binding protein [Bacillus thermotolerans]|uniref:Tricarboxylate transport protein TctC n=1 Tax=Bacillus thermotolerans TaxID=1221996 RepID=A0A0F5I6F0_BACTR|nr:tripartite tricarboxylate transporter substrate binding protein [Bacillus thermotolerans]KKB36164.1 Tricarboxylate transport protein TctC [Bacillus thermotolerans]KKB41209.1 Tricarboxylate transport protein TctC [Bacillus thermotolerans]KKB44071.1 Tricarboxylate transport protein TctC [Bacillus thermotolerans]